MSLKSRAYDTLVTASSWLHYAVLSRYSESDEGGLGWYRRRLDPELPAGADGKVRIWIHAVSAGETKVAKGLRRALLDADPNLSVVQSTTTYSGYSRIKGPDGFIMPLDTFPAQRRVVETLDPDLMVLVESEYWPAQFAATAGAGVPIAIVNATMSPRSFARHNKHPIVARNTLLRANHIFAQDEEIASRYVTLGVPRERVEISGNLKFAPLPGPPPVRDTSGGETITFGSVHAEEVPKFIPAIEELRHRRPGLRIVLMPRYPGKTSPEPLEKHFGTGLTRIDDIAKLPQAGKLVWLEQMGTLGQVYSMSEVGIVCGSFIEHGGHDLVEPLHFGAASVYGPDVRRQLVLHRELEALGCALQVKSAEALAGELIALLESPARRRDMVQRLASLARLTGEQQSTLAHRLVRLAAEHFRDRPRQG